MSEDGKNLTSLDPLIGTLELNFNFYQQHQHQQKKTLQLSFSNYESLWMANILLTTYVLVRG